MVALLALLACLLCLLCLLASSKPPSKTAEPLLFRSWVVRQRNVLHLRSALLGRLSRGLRVALGSYTGREGRDQKTQQPTRRACPGHLPTQSARAHTHPHCPPTTSDHGTVSLDTIFSDLGLTSLVHAQARPLYEPDKPTGRRLRSPTHLHARTITHSPNHPLANPHTRTLAHPHTRTPTHSHTRTLAHSHTHSLTHLRTRALTRSSARSKGGGVQAEGRLFQTPELVQKGP